MTGLNWRLAMRNLVMALALLAATSGAEASSFVVLGEEPPAATPSIISLNDERPVQSASLVHLGSPAPVTTAFEREREIEKPAPPPLAQASLPTVIRGGIEGDAFARTASPRARPAVGTQDDAAEPAQRAATSSSGEPAPSPPAPVEPTTALE